LAIADEEEIKELEAGPNRCSVILKDKNF